MCVISQPSLKFTHSSTHIFTHDDLTHPHSLANIFIIIPTDKKLIFNCNARNEEWAATTTKDRNASSSYKKFSNEEKYCERVI